MKRKRKLSEETIRNAIDQALSIPFPIPELQETQITCRVHDDCDGDREQQLILALGSDGDIRLRVHGPEQTLRFRNMIGGTGSPHTHHALRILMLAMIKDAQLDSRNTQKRP